MPGQDYEKTERILAKVEATIGEGPTNNKNALLGFAESIHSKK